MKMECRYSCLQEVSHSLIIHTLPQQLLLVTETENWIRLGLVQTFIYETKIISWQLQETWVSIQVSHQSKNSYTKVLFTKFGYILLKASWKTRARIQLTFLFQNCKELGNNLCRKTWCIVIPANWSLTGFELKSWQWHTCFSTSFSSSKKKSVITD